MQSDRTIHLAQGDAETISAQLTDNGRPVNLSGRDVRFVLRHVSTGDKVADGLADIVDADAGRVSFYLASTQTGRVGVHNYEWVIEGGSEDPTTLPRDAPGVLRIRQDVEQDDAVVTEPLPEDRVVDTLYATRVGTVDDPVDELYADVIGGPAFNNLDADTLDGLDSTAFYQSGDNATFADLSTTGQVDHDVTTADFIVRDDDSALSNLIWVDQTNGEVRLGSDTYPVRLRGTLDANGESITNALRLTASNRTTVGGTNVALVDDDAAQFGSGASAAGEVLTSNGDGTSSWAAGGGTTDPPWQRYPAETASYTIPAGDFGVIFARRIETGETFKAWEFSQHDSTGANNPDIEIRVIDVEASTTLYTSTLAVDTATDDQTPLVEQAGAFDLRVELHNTGTSEISATGTMIREIDG